MKNLQIYMQNIITTIHNNYTSIYKYNGDVHF